MTRRSADVKRAAAVGRAQARADRRAGGFANATDHPTPTGMTDRQEAAYNRAYRRAAPRSWYRK